MRQDRDNSDLKFSAVSQFRAAIIGSTMRVLVVEDEQRLAAGLRKGLEAEGFAVDVVHNGTDGVWMARENPFDAIVLDIMLPGANGYQVCRTLRGEGNWTPILMLTAKVGVWDEVEGLDTGADDYLSKPFSYAVLIARLRALLRRGARPRPTVLEVGDLRLDPATRQVWLAGVQISLTPREFAILEYLSAPSWRGTSEKGHPRRTSGTSTSMAIRTSSRCTCGGYAPSCTGRTTDL